MTPTPPAIASEPVQSGTGSYPVVADGHPTRASETGPGLRLPFPGPAAPPFNCLTVIQTRAGLRLAKCLIVLRAGGIRSLAHCLTVIQTRADFWLAKCLTVLPLPAVFALSLFAFPLSSFAESATLADLPMPSANFMGNFIFAACGLLAGAVAVKALQRNPPLEGTFLTKADFLRHEEADRAEFAALREAQTQGERRVIDRIDVMQSTLEAHSERRAIATHERLNDLVAQVSAQGSSIRALERNQSHS